MAVWPVHGPMRVDIGDLFRILSASFGGAGIDRNDPDAVTVVNRARKPVLHGCNGLPRP